MASKKYVCPIIEPGVCYTIEAALEMALEMEEEGFRRYLANVRMVKDRAAKAVLKDAAVDKLQHKQQLEMALLEGVEKEDGKQYEVPTMNLDYVLDQEEIGPDADNRKALAFAIHMEKMAMNFYTCLVQGCEGAPMVPVFQKLLNDESKLLKSLEDLYERHFLTEN